MNDRFYLCYFETTRRCNLTCKYCMARPKQQPSEPELSTDEARTLVLDEIATLSTDAAVAFSGGEHLLRPDAYDLLAHAAGRGMWSFINTNGRLLVETDAVRKAVRATDGKVVFALPLNSTDIKVNHSSRNDDPTTVMQAAKVCRKAGAEYFFILTVSRENLHTLDKTVHFLRRKRKAMLRAPLVPRGSGGNYADLLVDRHEMRDTVHPALSGNPLSYISFTPFFASPEKLEELWKRYRIRIEGVGCQAGRSFAAVGAEGGITPCVQLLDSDCTRGNVRKTRLSTVIREDPVFKALRSRDALKGKCGRCRYKNTCGGCRALSFYHTGDILAEDPTCFFEPEDPSTRSPLEKTQTATLAKFARYLKLRQPWKSIF